MSRQHAIGIPSSAPCGQYPTSVMPVNATGIPSPIDHGREALAAGQAVPFSRSGRLDRLAGEHQIEALEKVGHSFGLHLEAVTSR